jgi:hypothetical protein
MPASGALLGYGSVFEIQTENSPDAFAAVAEVTNIKPPSADIDQVDVTHMQSPLRYREFIDGLIDAGECSFDINFIPGNSADDRMFELLSLRSYSRAQLPHLVAEWSDVVILWYSDEV